MSVSAQFTGNSLSQAVDNTAFNFVTEAPSFFRQTSISNFDGDAAASARIGNNQASAMITFVPNATRVQFDWRVSSEAGYDGLAFVVLDRFQNETGIDAGISGNVPWNSRSFNIPAGGHFLAWVYIKDGSISSGDDRGWVDNVRIGNTGNQLSQPARKPVSGNLPAILNLLLN